jgi:hypothetical protein
MIDNLSLALAHGLLLLCAWRMLSRVDLDDEAGEAGSRSMRPTRMKSDHDA